MKTIGKVSFILVVTCTICFAGSSIIEVKFADSKKHEVKILSGAVKSVSLADPRKGVHSTIVVTSDLDKNFVILVEPTTTIYDALRGPVSLNYIKRGNRVKVKYTSTDQGANEALSIYLLQRY